MKIKSYLTILTLVGFALFLPSTILAVPAIPLYIYGDVSIGGANAPIGTTISAEVNGAVKASAVTTQSGKYGINVSPDDCSVGATVELKVNGVVGGHGTCVDPQTTPTLKVDLATPATTTTTITTTTTTTVPPTTTTTTTTTVPPSGGGSITTTTIPPTTTTTTKPGTTTTTTKPVSQMTLEELQAELTRLIALLAQLQGEGGQLPGQPSAISSIPETFKFNVNLQFGQVLIDVKYLQIVLNSESVTMVASTGPGSPGNETTYFGLLTKAAVIKFQDKYKAEILTPLGLTKGTGYVGPATRTKLNALLGR